MIDSNITRGENDRFGKQTLLISSGRCRVFRDGRTFNGIRTGELSLTAAKSRQHWSLQEYSLGRRPALKWASQI